MLIFHYRQAVFQKQIQVMLVVVVVVSVTKFQVLHCNYKFKQIIVKELLFIMSA